MQPCPHFMQLKQVNYSFNHIPKPNKSTAFCAMDSNNMLTCFLTKCCYKSFASVTATFDNQFSHRTYHIYSREQLTL